MCVPTCEKIAVVSCAEKDSLCGTVMIHDGLNLRCLDQCHRVRSRFRRRWFMQVCHAFVDINVFLRLRKQRPRFAQGQPKGSFQLKELHTTTKAYSQMNPDWKVDKAQYAEFNVPTWGKIAGWQLCRERQPLWNSHDSWWPELKIFGSMPWCSFPWQKLLPKLAQKTCHTTVWIWSMSLHPCFAEDDLCRFA